MLDLEKLSSPSYVDMVSGFKVQGDASAPQPPSTIIAEHTEREADNINLQQWKDAAARYTSGAKPEGESGMTLIRTQGLFSREKLIRPRIPGAERADANRTYKPAYRKSTEGFNRYIKAMDSAMNNNLSVLKVKFEE